MKEMIKNELIKLFKRKRIFYFEMLLLIFSISILLLFYFSNGSYAVNKDISIMNQLDKQIATLNDNEEKNKLIEKRDNINRSLEYDKNLSDESFDWKDDLKNKNIEMLSEKEQTTDLDMKEIIQVKIDMNNYLINNDISPTSKYDISNYTILIKTIMILGTIFIFIFIALSISDIVSNEYINDTIQLVFLRPVNMTKYIFSKIIASLFFITISILIFYLFIFIASGILFGFGSYNSPVYINPYFEHSNTLNSYYSQYITPIKNTICFLPIWKVVAFSLILQFLFICCCIIYCTLLSTVFKNNITSISISILTPLIAYISSNLLAKGSIMRFTSLFFPFLSDSPSIVTKDYIINSGAEYINFTSSLFILFLWIIILSLLTFLVSKHLKYNK